MKTAGIVLLLLVATLAVPIQNSFAQALTVSDPPTNLLSQTVSGSQINLSWSAPVNAIDDDVNGYRIERDIGCIGIFDIHVANTTTTNTTYSDTGLLNGFCYAYQISALNPVGSSIPSNIVNATTWSTPTAPTGLNVTAISNSSLKLSWVVPFDDGSSPITGYQIQRNGTILVADTANNQPSYIDDDLPSHHEQIYRVAAWNGVGLGLFSANVTAKASNQTNTPPLIDKENLGQAVSDFVHKRNELFKKQREETHMIIKDCHDKIKNVNTTDRKQAREDCRELLHDLKERYKELRKQFKEEFKQFRDQIKMKLKEARQSELVDKEEIKEDEKEFKQEIKKEEKQFKIEVKQLEKDLKKQIKELKKEQKKNENQHKENDDKKYD